VLVSNIANPIEFYNFIARFQLTMAPAIKIMPGAMVSLITLCLHPLWRHHRDQLPVEEPAIAAENR
jgi:hypothetical protein